MVLELRFAADSGAYSLRTQKSNLTERQFLDAYIAFVHQHKARLRFYITLDVIDDAERTWDNLKYIESQGLRPIPVFHAMHDRKYLHRLLDNYEYLCFGGLVHSVVKYKRYDLIDSQFAAVWNKTTGKVTHRIHGLALSGNRMLVNYPWHSVDSTSALMVGFNGGLTIPMPIVREGKVVDFDYLCDTPLMLKVSNRKGGHWHVNTLTESYRQYFDRYRADTGLTEEELQDYGCREVANIYYLCMKVLQLAKLHRERYGTDFNYYLSGKPGTSMPTFVNNTLARVKLAAGSLPLSYLGTFFYRQHLEQLFGLTKDPDNGNTTTAQPSQPVIRPPTRRVQLTR